jgi:hypothetical protein
MKREVGPGPRSFYGGLRLIASVIVLIAILELPLAYGGSQPSAAPELPTESDDAFLNDLSHAAFTYFWEQADPGTGLVRDRAHAEGTSVGVASIAATGFGLTAMCIGVERQWVAAEQARARVRTTLRFFAQRAFQQHGWFYHWMDPATGARQWKSEVSSIDTALLLAGVLTARQYFANDAEIGQLATQIYNRIDFPWMLNGDPLLLSHGWTPEKGFISNRRDQYCELMILYLLAIGSPTHAIPPSSWYAWARPAISYAGYTYITGGPLFVHQYSQAWVDFRGRHDRTQTDYFANSVAATRAHRAFCLSLARQFPASYSHDIWGITASDSAKGYLAWGGPPMDSRIDGAVAPSAPGGSLMFNPEICLPALRAMYGRFGRRVYGRYGFVDAFNPTTGWTDPDVLGIDLGITLLSAENARTRNVWNWFMANPEPVHAMFLVGLKSLRPQVAVRRAN